MSSLVFGLFKLNKYKFIRDFYNDEVVNTLKWIPKIFVLYVMWKWLRIQCPTIYVIIFNINFIKLKKI